MFALTVLYKQPTDPQAFEKYYDTTHKEIAQRLPYVKRKALGKSVGTPGRAAPAIYRSAVLYFDGQEQAEAAVASPEGQALLADIPKFSTGGSEIFFSDISEITVH